MHLPSRWVVLVVGLLGVLCLMPMAACGSSSDDTGDAGGSSGSSGGSGGASGGSGSSSSPSSSGARASSSGDAGRSSSGASSGNNASSGSGGRSSSSGASDAGSGGGSGGDATTGGEGSSPAPCTNTDATQINIDSSGWVCGNGFGIQGAWYCYTDGMGTSSCQGTGYVPYSASSSAMCISGSTSSPPSSTVYGAGIGLVLNQAEHDAGKSAYDASSKNIVGFAVTVTGDSGGSVLNINFPTSAANAASPSVTVPGVSSGSSPVTYSVLFADAAITYNNKTPIPKVDPTSVYGVEVAMPADAVTRNYNFCVTKIVPLTAPPAAPSSCSSPYGPTFTNQAQVVVEGLGPYGVQNDVFGASDPMTMQAFYGGGSCAGFSATPNFDTTGSNTPGAFPSIVYGWGLGGTFYGGADPGGYAGGTTIASLGSATTSWSFTPGNGNYWDAAYDTWFAQNPTPLNAGLELMVWVARGSSANPLGGNGNPVQGQICGANWNVSTGTNGSGQPVVTYIRSSNTNSINNCDLKGFFMDAANNGRAGLSSSWYLLGIQAGFELYQQGTWTTNSYSVSVQ